MGSLFHELRRRNVFRVAGVYGVIGWLLAQAAALLEGALSMPGWFDTVVVSLLLLGFPIAMIFAWAFELTPEGVKPTAAVDPAQSIAANTGRKLDYAIIAGLALFVALVVADRFIARPAAPDAVAASAALTDNSIAVLPFVDMSPDSDQEYFADGISEELLNVLAKVQTLQVAGRTSAFAFKNDNRNLREIGEILNVSHILEGSVRKAGNRVRITAQLIKAADGYHLWSQTYDRDLTDIFAVQDEIAESILAEMKPFLPMGEDAVVAPSARAEIGAYEIFLKARDLMNATGGVAGYEAARTLLDQAIAIDPNYAPALAWRAYAESALSKSWGGVGETPLDQALPVIKSFADRAIAADATSPDAQFALAAYHAGLYVAEGQGQLDQVIATYRKAVALRPNFPQAQNDLAYFLTAKGEFEEAIAIFESVLAHDPGHRDANQNYIDTMISLGRFEEADAALARWMSIRPDATTEKLYRAYMLIEQAQSGDAFLLAESVEADEAEEREAREASMRFARYDIGDVDWIKAHATRPIHHAFAALLDGDAAGALAQYNSDPSLRSNPHIVITAYNRVLVAAGKYDDIVRYYNDNIKTPEAAIGEVDACGCGGMDFLVLAMQKAGHKDADKLLRLWGEMAARKSVVFARSYSYRRLEAARALLGGDEKKAAAEFSKAIDLGWRSVMFATGGLDYKDLPAGAEFDALQVRMLGLVNEQRAKLGVPALAGESS